MSLKGKTALVTGASSGIGLAIARSLASEGVRVALFARRAELLKRVAREISQDGQVIDIAGDVRKLTDVQSAIKKAIDAWGRIDILINNAGVYRTRDLLDTQLDEWQEMIDTNLTGPFLFCREAVPHMLENGGGDIVNISSVAGLRAFADCAAYCASKFGLVGFSKAIREELRQKGIRVILVHPGAVATELWDVADEHDVDLKAMLKPEDVAEAVISALRASPHHLQEEIVLTPIGGDI